MGNPWDPPGKVAKIGFTSLGTNGPERVGEFCNARLKILTDAKFTEVPW